jgi:RNA polymerase sigma factor (sigma-70 family)
VVSAGDLEGLLREHAPRALAALARRLGDLADAEDAVQEALVAAAGAWPERGVPDDPTAWLVTTAVRRHVDRVRSDSARRAREDAVVVGNPRLPTSLAPSQDDSLALLFSCAHPALAPSAAIPLTLRAVGGLTTAEIARLLLLTDAAVNQRIHRAKQAIRDSGERFRLPTPSEWPGRLRAVLHVLYLLATIGNAPGDTEGEGARGDTVVEALRLLRELDRLLPDEPEVGGLVALVLLTESRRPARTGPGGALVPLDEQDRTLWDRALIADGTDRAERAMRRGRVGTYQLQAAIAAVHAEAATADATDWAQIAGLYEVLSRTEPSPVAALNHAVAVGEAGDPGAGLALLEGLVGVDGAARRLGHRLPAARAHLLARLGDHAGAHEAYRAAARAATSVAERDLLTLRATRCAAHISRPHQMSRRQPG